MNKKTNLALALVGLCSLLTLVGATNTHPNSSPSSKVHPPQGGQASQSAVAALRSIAGTIKACPRIVEFDASRDSQESEGPLERSRLYYGPPIHVAWGVDHSDLLRSSHQGYVEFVIPREFWIPPDVRDRWASEAAGLYALMLQPMPPLKYRYEFALGPSGLQLTRVLFRTAGETDWKDALPGDKGPAAIGLRSVCWQSAVRAKATLSGAGGGRH